MAKKTKAVAAPAAPDQLPIRAEITRWSNNCYGITLLGTNGFTWGVALQFSQSRYARIWAQRALDDLGIVGRVSDWIQEGETNSVDQATRAMSWSLAVPAKGESK